MSASTEAAYHAHRRSEDVSMRVCSWGEDYHDCRGLQSDSGKDRPGVFDGIQKNVPRADDRDVSVQWEEPDDAVMVRLRLV